MSDELTWADSDGRYIYIIDPKKYFSFVRLKVSSEDGCNAWQLATTVWREASDEKRLAVTF